MPEGTEDHILSFGSVRLYSIGSRFKLPGTSRVCISSGLPHRRGDLVELDAEFVVHYVKIHGPNLLSPASAITGESTQNFLVAFCWSGTKLLDCWVNGFDPHEYSNLGHSTFPNGPRFELRGPIIALASTTFGSYILYT